MKIERFEKEAAEEHTEMLRRKTTIRRERGEREAGGGGRKSLNRIILVNCLTFNRVTKD